MDKYDFDKKLVKLDEILSELVRYIKFLRSRFDDVICELEDMRSDLEAFGDELDEEKKNE